MVIDEGDEVAGPRPAGRAEQVERTLEIDVPQLVHRGPLVARPGRPDVARTVRAVAGQEAVDLAVAQGPDATAADSAARRRLFQ